ncbi:MAG: MmgE/PrpD family protein [Rhodospirillales bacterium]|nr:MmgE/PrpD family protein [Rhodospirillales bacterium]
MPTVLEKLGAYAAGLRSGTIPPEALHGARRCVVDWFAAAIPGGVVPPATLLADVLAADGDSGRALLIPSGRMAGMRTAALVNGTASHTIEFDDIFRDAIYHPGSPVIAAALAAAQSRGRDGSAFLRGVIAGYEVSTRMGVALGSTHYEYWHTTGTVGSFGAAVAAAVVLGLDGAKTAHAISATATMAAALQESFRGESMLKPLHAGRAAETGVLAALAAEKGLTGVSTMLEGARGIGAAMSRNADWGKAFDGLGTRYNVIDTTQKNHACCGHTFAAIDAVIALRNQHKLTPENVKRISVGTYGKALEVANIPDPKTAFEAKFSLAYCCSVALATGRVRFEAFSPERLSDPIVRGAIHKVAAVVDPDADKAFPKRRSATVEIETTDGRLLKFHAPTRKGDPENPLTDAELTDKYRELVDAVMGERTSKALLDILWKIDSAGDLARLPLNVAGTQSAPAKVAVGR